MNLGSACSFLNEGEYIFEVTRCFERVMLKLYLVNGGYIPIAFDVESSSEIFAAYAAKILDGVLSENIVWLKVKVSDDGTLNFEWDLL